MIRQGKGDESEGFGGNRRPSRRLPPRRSSKNFTDSALKLVAANRDVLLGFLLR